MTTAIRPAGVVVRKFPVDAAARGLVASRSLHPRNDLDAVAKAGSWHTPLEPWTEALAMVTRGVHQLAHRAYRAQAAEARVFVDVARIRMDRGILCYVLRWEVVRDPTGSMVMRPDGIILDLSGTPADLARQISDISARLALIVPPREPGPLVV
jgi:hypothetical protein